MVKFWIEWGTDIDTCCGGSSTRTVEDSSRRKFLDDLESLFGRDVAFLVDGVTVFHKLAPMRNLVICHTKDNLTKLMIAVGEDVRVIIIKLSRPSAQHANLCNL